jgi:thiamine kinase
MSHTPLHLARTGMADIITWSDTQILKLYHRNCSPTVADREALKARAAHAAGIPTPAVIDVVTVDGRVGVIFERATGPTMLQLLAERPERTDDLAKQLAALHAHVHTCQAPDLPSHSERLRVKIGRAVHLSEELRAAALASLDRLPDGETLCHGDFQPGDVILTSDGPSIIDWYDATRGDPAADVARTAVLIQHADPLRSQPSHTRRALAAVRGPFLAAYLRHYRTLRPLPPDRLDAWLLPEAAARASETASAAEHEALASFILMLRSPKK